jgi:hypothetical protein
MWPERCNRRELPSGRARSAENDAVPGGSARGTGTGTAGQVASTGEVHLQCRSVTDGLTTGSGVHL